MSKWKWCAVLLVAFALMTIVGCRAFQDSKYQEAKAKAEASQESYKAAVALFEGAKTETEKEVATLKVQNAKAQFDSDVANLDKIAAEPISTPATGFLGMIACMVPGVPGWIFTAASTAVAIGVNIARKRNGLALKEVAVGYEIVTNELAKPERKAKRRGLADILKGTGGDIALNKVLKKAGLFERSKAPTATPPSAAAA